MSREFSLVLLGAGLLTAGYFLMPEDDPIQRAHANAENGGGGSGGGYRRTGHVLIFYAGGGSRPFGSSSALSSTRGGFGRSAISVGS